MTIPRSASTLPIRVASLLPEGTFPAGDTCGCIQAVIMTFVCAELAQLVSPIFRRARRPPQVRIPLMEVGHPRGKPITVPEGNRSGVGAKRRWQFDVAKTDTRLIEIVKWISIRSGAKVERSWRGWGRRARGGNPLPRLGTEETFI